MWVQQVILWILKQNKFVSIHTRNMQILAAEMLKYIELYIHPFSVRLFLDVKYIMIYKIIHSLQCLLPGLYSTEKKVLLTYDSLENIWQNSKKQAKVNKKKTLWNLFCVIFDTYCQTLISGGHTANKAAPRFCLEIFSIFPNFQKSYDLCEETSIQSLLY